VKSVEEINLLHFSTVLNAATAYAEYDENSRIHIYCFYIIIVYVLLNTYAINQLILCKIN
jgi:hypothetical protein